MPYFMDRHDSVDITPEELAGAHAMDLEVQAKYGVNYLSYWFDPSERSVFCFVDAPDKESCRSRAPRSARPGREPHHPGRGTRGDGVLESVAVASGG